MTKTIYPLSEDPHTDREWDTSRRQPPSPHMDEGESEMADSSLPPAHNYAANGDVDALTSLLESDPHATLTQDTINRTAVFYACANDQVNLTKK